MNVYLTNFISINNSFKELLSCENYIVCYYLYILYKCQVPKSFRSAMYIGKYANLMHLICKEYLYCISHVKFNLSKNDFIITELESYNKDLSLLKSNGTLILRLHASEFDNALKALDSLFAETIVLTHPFESDKDIIFLIGKRYLIKKSEINTVIKPDFLTKKPKMRFNEIFKDQSDIIRWCLRNQLPIKYFCFPKGTLSCCTNNDHLLVKIRSYFYPLKIVNKQNLRTTVEGNYSMSHWKDALNLCQYIKQNIGQNLRITDATAGIGGNTIIFAEHFPLINAIDINEDQILALSNNLEVYNLANKVRIFQNDYSHVLNQLDEDVVFLDPPWGGPTYKVKNCVSLYLSGVPIHKIVNQIIKKGTYCLLKVPVNFDLKDFEKYIRIHDIFSQKKYNIVVCKPENII